MPLQGTPVNRLFFSINHYVSTGDHFGEGLAMDTVPGALAFMIPVNTRMEGDAENFRRLEARIRQLRDHPEEWPVRLTDEGRQGLYHIYALHVPAPLVEPLAAKLREEPGPLGWGSPKKIIDSHDWHE